MSSPTFLVGFVFLMFLVFCVVYMLTIVSCLLGHVSYCHHFSSVVCCPSVNISHFNLLLRNHWANCNQTLVEWSLGGPLPKLCPVIPTSNQDGHQAKNRKRGGWIKKKIYWANLNQTLLKWSLGGPLPKLCLVFQTSDQDGDHSRA